MLNYSICEMLLLFLLLLDAVAADPNQGSALTTCNPAQCTVDGDCYCGQLVNGWYNGGVATDADFRGPNDPVCEKLGTDCQCPDCGQIFIFNNVQCQDWRCDDDSGFEDPTTGACYTVDSSGHRVPTSTSVYFNCYKQVLSCNPSRCAVGQGLVGCLRYSPGTCVSCSPDPAPGYYWSSPGSCATAPCTAAQPGQ